MSLWNPKSISGKLTRMNVLVSGIALVLAYVSFLVYDLYSLRQNLINSLSTEAAIVGENSVSALTFDDPQSAQNTLAALRRSPHILLAAITRSDGTAFAQYRCVGTYLPLDFSRLRGTGTTRSWYEGDRLFVQTPIFFQGQLLGTVVLEAETTDVISRTRQFGLISAGILLLSFLAAILATSSIRHLITRPLSQLAETAQVVSRDQNYSVRAEMPQSGDEIAFLVESFNSMLEQIEQRDAALEESRAVLERRVEERTAALSAANRELEAFSYSVAHDLRGPLQQITNIGFLLQTRLAGTDNHDDSVLVDKISEGSTRMSRLIDDLLNLSHATSTPLRRRAVNLTEMAEKIVSELQAGEPERQAEIHLQENANVVADEGLMSLVLENLLRNAWKYTSKRQDAKIEFGYRNEGAEIVYFVSDNGVGFSPQFVDMLFRPFQRLHPKSEFPGTGVGLATVQRIIARHGGKVWARGEMNKGAEFAFTVPNGEAETKPLAGYDEDCGQVN
jgi:signal transduction histidine kinase